jgi:hypothetical protein
MASRAIEGRRPACNAIPIANSHHRIEHRHARQLSGGKRRCYDNPIQEQARQNFVTVPAGPSLDDWRVAGAGPAIKRFGKFGTWDNDHGLAPSAFEPNIGYLYRSIKQIKIVKTNLFYRLIMTRLAQPTRSALPCKFAARGRVSKPTRQSRSPRRSDPSSISIGMT